MTYTPMLIVHILGGTLAVASGFVAMFLRKGSRRHRITGDVFVVSMIFMGLSGAWIAFVKSQHANVLAGTLTPYLVLSAWSTAWRKRPHLRPLNIALCGVAFAVGAAAIAYGVTARNGVTYFVFAAVALLFATGDVRMLVRGGVDGTRRMTRHIWRMGFAHFVATGSFFLGRAGDPVMKKSGLRAQLFNPWRASHLPEIPVLIGLLITFYWLGRVLITREYEKRKPATPPPLELAATELS